MASEKKSDDALNFDESKFDVIYYATKRCPFSQRVRSTLEVKGIKYKYVEVTWTYDHSSGSRVVTKPKWFTDIYKQANGRNVNSNGQSPIIKLVKTQKLYTDSQPCCRLLDNVFKDCGSSIIAYNDSDILFHNEILNGYITSGFARKTGPSNKEELGKFKDELKVLNDKICQFTKDGEKYIFGDSATLSDICLLPYICRVNSYLKYYNLENEFNFQEFVQNNCQRLYKWITFVMAQDWAKNVVMSDDDYIFHYKEYNGK
eukprot:307534_1